LPLALVPYRCKVCQLSFNHRQSLSRHLKKQHRLPAMQPEPGLPASAASPLWQAAATQLDMELLTAGVDQVAWAFEAAAAALAIAPPPNEAAVDVEPVADGDGLHASAEVAASEAMVDAAETARDGGPLLEPVSSSSSSEDESERQAPMVRQVIGVRQPATSAGRVPRKDIRQELAVDRLVRSWGPRPVIGTADLFRMIDAGLSRQPVGEAAAAISRRYHLSGKARSQTRRRLAAMVYGYRQAQEEVRNLLPVGPCDEAAAVVALQNIAAWAMREHFLPLPPCE